MLRKNCITYEQLLKEFPAEKVGKMMVTLELFPTPFKGIYYAPIPQERKAAYIESPRSALTRSISLFLKKQPFYYSCTTALEAAGRRWQPSGEIHVVNGAISKRIDLVKRIQRNEKRNTLRARKIAGILEQYGRLILFHRNKEFEKSKFRHTPYGPYATIGQAKKDIRRFHREK